MRKSEKPSPYIVPGLKRDKLLLDIAWQKSNMVIEIICDYFGIPSDQVKGKDRHRPIVEARQMVCFFLRKKTRLSLTGIGRELGNKDHATVIHAIEAVENRIFAYPDVKKQVSELNLLLR